MERAVAALALVLGFIVLGMWWLETRFGSGVAFNVLMGITHLLAFAGGSALSLAITRSSLRAVNDYARVDAQTDRYRQQTFKEQVRGDSALRRAAAQLQVMDARRVETLARDRARILTRREQEAERLANQPVDTWDWEDDDSTKEQDYHQAGWE